MSRKYAKIVEELILYLGTSALSEKSRRWMARTKADAERAKVKVGLYKEIMKHLRFLLEVRRCRECGCTEFDNAGCVKRSGKPCHWVSKDLCSACLPVGEPSNENRKRR